MSLCNVEWKKKTPLQITEGLSYQRKTLRMKILLNPKQKVYPSRWELDVREIRKLVHFMTNLEFNLFLVIVIFLKCMFLAA